MMPRDNNELPLTGASRRQFIRGAAGTGLMGGLAGCGGLTDDGEPDEGGQNVDGQDGEQSGIGALDTAIVNANIVTMDDHSKSNDPGTRVNAMGINHGYIDALGEDEVDPLVGDDTRVLDLDGRTVIPGLIVGHTHVEGSAYGDYPELEPDLPTPPQIEVDVDWEDTERAKQEAEETILSAIEEEVQDLDPGEGGAVDEWLYVSVPTVEPTETPIMNQWTFDPEWVSQEKIDEVAPENPVIVRYTIVENE